jgi:hypothetical protein
MNGNIYFTLLKKGEQSFKYTFAMSSYQKRFERHLKQVGVPYQHISDYITVDVTKIISIAGYERSVIFGNTTYWK